MIKWSVTNKPLYLRLLWRFPSALDWTETWLSPEVTASLVVLSRGCFFSHTRVSLHLKRRDDLIVGSWLCRLLHLKIPALHFVSSDLTTQYLNVSTFVSPSLMALARGSLSLSPSLFLHKSWWLIQYPSFSVLRWSFFQWSLFHCISGTHSMITPIPVLQPFSCHGTHRMTFADHTACGQMQLTS